jgi:uncharacterized membrane protein
MKKISLLPAVLLVSVTATYAQFAFTPIDYPGAAATGTYGINNHHDIVGWYDIALPRHAMLINCFHAPPLPCGQYLPLDPTTILGQTGSAALKINDRGDVVGFFAGDGGFNRGFLLRHGVLTTLDFPGASETFPYGINESGTVVGAWDVLDSDGNLLAEHGFIWNSGTFTSLDYPGSADTTIRGINAGGDFVGEWTEVNSSTGHGFVFSEGQFVSFDVPFDGAIATQANAINDVGHIAGVYADASGVLHGFLAVGAKFTPIDYPGAAQTAVWGINNADQIVGNHYDNLGGMPRGGFLAQYRSSRKARE